MRPLKSTPSFIAEPECYSPELNPIEMAWAWVKKHLRRRAPHHIRTLRKSIEAAWATVTSALCAGWLRHCGYDAAST